MNVKKGEPVLSGVAIAYGREHASQLFDGRRGHGGANARRVLMSRTELEDNLAVAFQLGQSMTAKLSRVKS